MPMRIHGRTSVRFVIPCDGIDQEQLAGHVALHVQRCIFSHAVERAEHLGRIVRLRDAVERIRAIADEYCFEGIRRDGAQTPLQPDRENDPGEDDRRGR